MMPIVDPHVGLSCDGLALNDYLTLSDNFHVLRMVAVQQPQSFDSVLANLRYYRELSTTRGYGGFPNGMVAYCDLAEAGALSKLLDNEFSTFVRGVHFSPSAAVQNTIQSSDCLVSLSSIEQLELLNSRELSLDMSVSIGQCKLVDTIARRYPELVILVTMQDWAQWLDTGSASFYAEQIALLANNENVHIKLCDNRCSKSEDYAVIQNIMIDQCVNLFGFERIMFASYLDTNVTLPFNAQWRSYLNATENFTAKQRDKLFRSNAIRSYRL